MSEMLSSHADWPAFGIALWTCLVAATAAVLVWLILWQPGRARPKATPPRLDESRALEQRALSPEPTAPDIYASRLIALMIASRVVFPWVRNQQTGDLYPPVSAIWQGTAAKLRETLTTRGSRLSFNQRRELPAPEVLDHRLGMMARCNGRVRIERIGYADGQVWRITLNH